VYVTTPELTDEKGTAHFKVTVDNQAAGPVTAVVKTEIMPIDAKGNAGAVVASSKAVPVEIDVSKSAVAEFDVSVSQPKRWDITAPNRYLSRTTISMNGKVVDQYDLPFGFRTLEFTAKDGFHLNGRRVPIQGVCQHHDLGPLGAAVNTRALERQVEILLEMGCNAIRTSHNPPTPELLEICDRLGMLVEVETFDCWRAGKKDLDYGIVFDEWHERDLQNVVRRDRNNPCVFMWNTGN
jgi:beta-galactosidase